MKDEKYQMNGAVLGKTNVFIENRENDEKELNSVVKSEENISFNQHDESYLRKDIVSDFSEWKMPNIIWIFYVVYSVC
mgnify:CR=1 FL=1